MKLPANFQPIGPLPPMLLEMASVDSQKQFVAMYYSNTNPTWSDGIRKIALISSYNFLSGSVSGKSRELGIKTDDPEIIAALLLRSELDFN